MLQRLQTAIAGAQRLTKVPALAADVERFLAALAQQHMSLEDERGQLRALATTLILLDKAPQAEDILEPDEPRHRR